MGTDQNGFMGRNGYGVLVVVVGKQNDVGKGSRLGHREKSEFGVEVLVALLDLGLEVLVALPARAALIFRVHEPARYAGPHVGVVKDKINKRRNLKQM